MVHFSIMMDNAELKRRYPI